MRDLFLIVVVVGLLVVARPLAICLVRWIERSNEVRLQRELAEADAFHYRFFNDPEFALAYVRQQFPEEHEMIADLERRAAAAAEGAPWLPGHWSDERV